MTEDAKHAGHIAMNSYVVSALQLVMQSQALASRLAEGHLARHAQPCEDAAAHAIAALSDLYTATHALLNEYGVMKQKKRRSVMESN